jgi:acetyl-CoA carboxylase alpha subunit
MSQGIRKRIVREATPEEKERHRVIREQVEQELPELTQWARAAAARHQDRVAVGTVLTGEETQVAQAIDNYAAEHALSGRSAVVREALAKLLGVELARK